MFELGFEFVPSGGPFLVAWTSFLLSARKAGIKQGVQLESGGLGRRKFQDPNTHISA